jgi:hypothetical protein
MANRFYRGVNADTTDTANWSATRTGATGQTVPGSGDVAYFYDGDIDVNANTSFAAGTCYIGGKFRGNINGLLFSTAACVVTVETVAPNKILAIGPAASTTLTAIRIRNTGSGSVQITGGASSAVTTVTCGKKATLYVLGAGIVTNLYSMAKTLLIEYAATAITLLEVRGSEATAGISRAVTTLTAIGGARSVATDSVAITTLNVQDSTHSHDSIGTIGTCNAYPGGNLLPVASAFTLTDANLWEGGNISYGNNKITNTNDPVPIGDVL